MQNDNYQDIVLAPLSCKSDEDVMVEKDLDNSEDATQESIKAINLNTVLSAIEKIWNGMPLIEFNLNIPPASKNCQSSLVQPPMSSKLGPENSICPNQWWVWWMQWCAPHAHSWCEDAMVSDLSDAPQVLHLNMMIRINLDTSQAALLTIKPKLIHMCQETRISTDVSLVMRIGSLLLW